MNALIFLPLIIPFSTALLLLIWRHNAMGQKCISLLSSLLLLGTSARLITTVFSRGPLVGLLGNWPPPFGISLAVDGLGAIMVGISSLVGFTTLLFSFHDIKSNRMKGSYYALFFFLLFGVNGAFTTGDLFNLFVFFEVLLMTSYVLMILGNEEKQVKAGFTYLTLNLVGSTLFLAGAGIMFGQFGSLNMAHIANQVTTVEQKGLVSIACVIFFFVFGLKSAMFPLNNWLPQAYTAPPVPICALFAGLLTKVGVYSMYRVFGTIFIHDTGFTLTTLLLPLAGLTMLLGVGGAVVQYDVRSILAFHSISQVGYILMGLAVFTPLALAGGIFHMIHHSVIKSSLFLIGGGIHNMGGTQNLKKLGGLLSKSSYLAFFFMVSAMALAGVPPLSGFFSKYALVVSGLAARHPWLVTSALVTGFFTLYSMIKIWRLGFWGIESEQLQPPAKPVLMSTGVSVLFVVLLTVYAGPVMKMCMKAGEDLLNRDVYIQSVLQSKPVPHPQREAP